MEKMKIIEKKTLEWALEWLGGILSSLKWNKEDLSSSRKHFHYLPFPFHPVRENVWKIEISSILRDIFECLSPAHSVFWHSLKLPTWNFTVPLSSSPHSSFDSLPYTSTEHICEITKSTYTSHHHHRLNKISISIGKHLIYFSRFSPYTICTTRVIRSR